MIKTIASLFASYGKVYGLAAWMVVGWLGQVWAGQAVVTTIDGKQYEGEVVQEDDEQVTIVISGIKTPILRENIQQIQYAESIEDQYRQRRDGLEDNDWQGRYELAKWLFDQQHHQLAFQELKNLQAVLTDAVPKDLRYQIDLLERALSFRIKLLEEKKQAEQEVAENQGRDPSEGSSKSNDGAGAGQNGAGADSTQPADASPGATADPATPPGSSHGSSPGVSGSTKPVRPLLNEDQINMIKVFELPEDLFVSRPNVRIPADAIAEIYRAYEEDDRLPSKKEFIAWPGYKQLDKLFELKARHLYRRVEVRTDPPVMKQFRRIHRQYVLNYCGAANCHGAQSSGGAGRAGGGSGGAGGFLLHRDRGEDEQTVYTNFMILHETSVNKFEMIDRLDPSRSLLLTYGMPHEGGELSHPQVEGWRPRVMSEQAPMYRVIHDWIGPLWKPAPDYGIPHAPKPGQDDQTEPQSDDPTTESPHEPETDADDSIFEF